MPHPQSKPKPAPQATPSWPTVERFAVPIKMLKATNDLRLDASHFNPDAARALETLRHSGMRLERLGNITKKIFIPNRFKRIYVAREYGLPFLQGSHIVHFQPADIKYVSRFAHKKIEQWIIEEGWILVTRSGTVGRVALCPPEWSGWAASEHILRVIPDESACPSGYLYSFLSSPLGYIQLTKHIYGAVVDELTEDQARSVLVPLPVTKEQESTVAYIDEVARNAISTRSKAIDLINEGAGEIASLIQGDREDIAIASKRLDEIEFEPNLVRGEALAKVLEELEAP
jgi:type I restriction enzyme, S subunit